MSLFTKEQLDEMERVVNELEEKLNEELVDFQKKVANAVSNYRDKYEKALETVALGRAKIAQLRKIREDENDASDDSLS